MTLGCGVNGGVASGGTVVEEGCGRLGIGDEQRQHNNRRAERTHKIKQRKKKQQQKREKKFQMEILN